MDSAWDNTFTFKNGEPGEEELLKEFFAEKVFGSVATFNQYQTSRIEDANTQDGVDRLIIDYVRSRRLLTQSSRKYHRQINKPEEVKEGRNLQAALPVVCNSEEDIRKYLKNKSLVVFKTESFVKEDGEHEVNQNELVEYLAPLAEKRLDFRYHKEIYASIEERVIEI